jgi:DNA-directed RNA polymerase subunit E"
MVVKQQKACRNCSRISEEDVCPYCGGQTSREFQGYLIIVDASRSNIAKQMNLTENGKYALRVR